MSVRVLEQKELVRLSVGIYRVLADKVEPTVTGMTIEELIFVFTEYDVDLIDDVCHWLVEYGALTKECDKFRVAPDYSSGNPF